MPRNLLDTLRENAGRQFALHDAYVNPQMREMLRLVGMDADYVRASGSWLVDATGRRYLDLITHSSVFSIGHNHPHVTATLKAVLDAELPNILLMDCSLLSGLLAERLLKTTPHLGKVYFGSSGSEAVEASLKLARGKTGRPRIVSFAGAYHGLSYGALSTVGHDMWREGFQPFLPGCVQVPWNDALAVERELVKGDVACVLGETIQGDGGVNFPDPGFWPAVAKACKQHGALLILDEIQVGMGRVGQYLHAYQHYGVLPDMLLLGKAISGGQAPVSAVLMTDAIFAKVFSRVDRCFIHSGTYCENNLSMAAAWATLDVYEDEDLLRRSAEQGAYFLERMKPLQDKYEMVHEVRGKGLLLALELGAPQSMSLKAGWHALSAINEGLCAQMVIVPLFRDHDILVQVGGHNFRVIKMMPPLSITREEIDRVVVAFDQVLAECHRFPGGNWGLVMEMARRAAVGLPGASKANG
jgi:ornithine--oxo-acid transaminase